jgi:hypothetical protein
LKDSPMVLHWGGVRSVCAKYLTRYTASLARASLEPAAQWHYERYATSGGAYLVLALLLVGPP